MNARPSGRWPAPARILAAAIVVWIIAAFWLVPWGIRAAYEERLPAALNTVIAGRDRHAVTHYLAAWRVLALWGSITIVAIGLAVIVVARHGDRIRRRTDNAFSGLPSLNDRTLLASVIVLGLVSGLVEGTTLFVRYWVLRSAVGQAVSTEVFWMAPLAACMTLAGLSTVLVLARRLTRLDGRANVLILAALVMAAAFGFGRAVRLGLHPVALTVLAVGAATVVLRAVRRTPGRATRIAHRAAAWGVGALIVWGALMPVRQWWRARRDPPTAASSGSTARLNVLLLVWDTVRARSLSLYGYERLTSPNLDSFARQSIVFDAAVATASWTLPSHASLFTGRFHHEHSADRGSPLDATHPTLAEALGAKGFRTGGFVANTWWVGRGFGLDRGFQWYEDQPPTTIATVLRSWQISGAVHEALSRHGIRIGASDRVSARSVHERFLRWLDRGAPRPFFAFLNVFDAHEPYVPPDDYGFRFSPPRTTPLHRWPYTSPLAHTPAELAQLREAYDSCISYVDEQFGRLLAALDRRGLLDSTIVILTSDHGETLGEHASNLLGHENNVYYDVLNVPLVIYHPSLARGRRVEAPVTLADLPATVWDLVGMTDPNPFPGRSLVAEDPSTARIRPIISQANPAPWHRDDFDWPIARGPLFSVVDGTRHITINAHGEARLFDLTNDPWELSDLGATESGRAELTRHRRVVEWIQGRGRSP